MRVRGLSADLVMRNGNVITVDAKDTSAEAVAIRDGIILRVGTNADMEPLIGKRTEVMDLKDKTVVPGFIDSHTHNVNIDEFRYNFNALNIATELNPTIADVQRKIRERAKETPKGDWIGGRNFDPNGLEEGRWPSREELDACAPENPLMITTIRRGHACAVNSTALE